MIAHVPWSPVAANGLQMEDKPLQGGRSASRDRWGLCAEGTVVGLLSLGG